MAQFLYRLGRMSFLHRRLALAIWVGILVLSSIAAATLSGPTSTSFSIPGTPAQQAIDTLQARFPAADAAGASARVVFAAPEGVTLTDACQCGRGHRRPGTGPGCSQGRVRDRPIHERYGQPRRTRGVRAGDVLGALHRAQGSRSRDPHGAAEPGRVAGLTVEVGGDALQPAPEQGASEAIGIAHRGRGPVHHLRLVRRGWPAAADRAPGYRHRCRPHHHGDRLRGAQRDLLDPGADDRARGVHRLRLVHPVPVPDWSSPADASLDPSKPSDAPWAPQAAPSSSPA